LPDLKVLIAGGMDGNYNQVSSAELYGPSAGTFTATGSLNVARSCPGLLLNNCQVLIVCGNFGPGTDQIYNMTELYDPPSGVFILNAPTNITRFFMSATFLNNGEVLITGQETSAITVT
jgi:hypothetical protein